MRTIELEPAVWTLLDDEDWERLHSHSWKRSKSGHVYRTERREGKAVRVWMHREVMESELSWRKGRWEVHHWDENKLNNQRANLLICEPRWHRRQHGTGYTTRKGGALRVTGDSRSQKRRTF